MPKQRRDARVTEKTTGNIPAIATAEATASNGGDNTDDDVEDFETFVRATLQMLVQGQKQLETKLAKSIEFNSERIAVLEAAKENTESQMQAMKIELETLQGQLIQQRAEVNKQERFSRRNNIRIVGMKKTEERENCIDKVTKLLSERFEGDNAPRIERAHRDGRGVDGNPPHVLVKFLSYTDKITIMKGWRQALQGLPIFITDDLTLADLTEKRKWRTEVKALYDRGMKLRFFAGKWRNGEGAIHKF